MLQLINIVKKYVMGDMSVTALNKVNLSFRKSEFVSILGQSGSGKTTLLNIIGGLDQYTEGDLIINGRSTKEYNGSDWDAYRNHSVGFVFQNYNLIPHQSVLSNVELALTLSGVSKSERRRRAREALVRVGLAEQLRKRPNQLSGGQMQRVAIARALAGNPDILLADEPTGALDSETSLAVMDILKEISKDRLVIMVTHNPQLAEKYSTRIIRLSDGAVTDDSSPYSCTEAELSEEAERKKERAKKKPSMSFITALSLSLNNLLTKKMRTILTSFAGSIGIIGIALVLSVSTGFQEYINRVQEDTLSSYPISIMAEEVDMSQLIKSLGNKKEEREQEGSAHEADTVYESAILYELMNSFNGAETRRNNLTEFKCFIEENEEIKQYLSAYRYSYDTGFNMYVKEADGTVSRTDINGLFSNMGGGAMMSQSSKYSAFSSYSVWEEMLGGRDGALINETLLEQYEVLAGHWPEKYNEVVLVVNKNNEVSDLVLYSLGLKSAEEMNEVMKKAQGGEEIDTSGMQSYSFDEILGMSVRMFLNYELYRKNTDGTYTDISKTDAGLKYLYGSEELGTTLVITGIIRASDSAVSSMLSGSLCYTGALTEYALEKTAASEIINKQLSETERDAINGMLFENPDAPEPSNEEKILAFNEYLKILSTAEAAELYRKIAASPSEEYLNEAVEKQLATVDRKTLEASMTAAYAENMGLEDTSQLDSYFASMNDSDFFKMAAESMREKITAAFESETLAALSQRSEAELEYMLKNTEYSAEQQVVFYGKYVPKGVSQSTCADNLKLLGYADKSSPSAINLYATSFENKDEIARIISEYNDGAAEENKINYTDYVALLMSSVTTIINAITYVLMAFVAISLVVSSIMIGIITYISVLERTKEIGILRAVGASKRDVSRVFNAETVIIGLTAGLLGIGISLLMLLPINVILHNLTGIEILSAILPVGGAVVLVVISTLLTFVAGLIPSGIAARKNPVEALRSE